MIEDEKLNSTELKARFAEVGEIVRELTNLTDAAYVQYNTLVEQILVGRITAEREIEHVMDSLVDFGNDSRFIALYKTLCRHIYSQYPTLVGEHIALFRLQFEEAEGEENERSQGR